MLAGLALGLQGASAAYSWWRSRDQASQQRAETAESLRRFEEESKRRLSTARAAGAASGIEFESGSIQDSLAKMSAEFGRQAEWIRTAGDRKASSTEMAGNFGLVGDLGGALFGYGNANNWWRDAPSVTK